MTKTVYTHGDEISKIVKCGGGLLFSDQRNDVYFFDTLIQSAQLIARPSRPIRGMNTSQNGAGYFTSSEKVTVDAFAV